MPNRILREGAIDSDRIAAVDELAEVLYYRLILLADDFGRFDGRLAIIRARAFPLRENIAETEIQRRLDALSDADLIHRYEAGGKPYLEIKRFGQRRRAAQSKFPSCPCEMTDRRQTSARGCPPGAESESESRNGGEGERERRARAMPPSSVSNSQIGENSDEQRPQATGLDSNWRPDAQDHADASGLGLTADAIEWEAGKFRDHFRGNGDRRKDWPATWRNWCRRTVQRGEHRGPEPRRDRGQSGGLVAAGREVIDFTRRKMAAERERGMG